MIERTSNLPQILSTAVGPFSRGYGIAPVAPLLLLQVVGAVAGGSVRTLSPHLFDCTPGFDIASIHGGSAMLAGALLSAFDGALLEIAVLVRPLSQCLAAI